MNEIKVGANSIGKVYIGTEEFLRGGVENLRPYHLIMILIGDKEITANLHVPSDGVVEAWQYLDFHKAGGNDRDYTCRLQDLNPEISRRISLPTEEGTLALSKDVSRDVLKKAREDRKVCSLRGGNFDENHWYPCDFDADPNSIVFPLRFIIHNTLNGDSQNDAKTFGMNLAADLVGNMLDDQSVSSRKTNNE